MEMKEFDKIIGYTAIKKELEQIADTLKNGGVYAKLGVSAPKGLLLHGDPGVGKTLMANCLIKASGRKCFTCRKDKPNGDFVKYIKQVFNEAEENAPSIVFLDDMDKFANGDERHRDEEEYVTVQSCIDEVKGKDVFVLATANYTGNLPRSLMRAGRFDRIIAVKAPTGNDAVRIVEHYLKGKQFVSDIDSKWIARVLDGRSCAELETVINEAGLYAGHERAECITMEHFMEACLRTIFNVPVKAFDKMNEDWLANLSNGDFASSQLVYHEVGHAVIAEVLSPGSVTLISAHGRRGSSNGFTAVYHDERENSAKWRIMRIIGSLGGMAAVELKFCIPDSGNRCDLDTAFDYVRNMVVNECACGLALHSSSFGDSADLMSKQEQAIASEVEKYYCKARDIILKNWDFFEALAVALAEKRLLNTADIQKIKSNFQITPVAI